MKNFFQNILALIAGLTSISILAFIFILLPIWKGTNSYDPDGSIGHHTKGTSFNNALGMTIFIVITMIVIFFLYLERKYKSDKRVEAYKSNTTSQKKKPLFLTIEETFPEFVKANLWNKQITTSTINKLLMTNYDDGEALSVGLEYNDKLDCYYLIGEYKDKSNNHFIADKIELGSFNKIIESKIDWKGYGGYNDAILANIIIEKTIFEFSNEIKLDASNIRFDGIYYIQDATRKGVVEVLRFYEDKTILNWESVDIPDNLEYLFDINASKINKGEYFFKNNFIISKLNKINSLEYRFIVSYLTNEKKLYTRLYGRYDRSLIFLPFKN